MADRSDRRRGPAPPRDGENDYEVGYGQPPVHSRFQPGQSGNPRGRPKGTGMQQDITPHPFEEPMKRVIREEAWRRISVREGDRQVRIPVIQAVIRAVALNAARGHQGAQRMFIGMLQEVEGEARAWKLDLLVKAVKYKEDWDGELARREETGEDGPEPLPHPDDVVIDRPTLEVSIRGPVLLEDRKIMEQLGIIVGLDRRIADLGKKAAKKPDDQALQKELETLRCERKRIAGELPFPVPSAKEYLPE